MASDHELAQHVSRARLAGGVARVGLIDGDLCRTISGPRSVIHIASVDAVTLSIDALMATFNEQSVVAVAHVVARRRRWAGPVVVVMNAEFLGTWDVATKGHPNDGVADVVEGELPFIERLKARRRLPLGAHVPHPLITQRRMAAGSFQFAKPAKIFVDGQFAGSSTNLDFEVLPDAFEVVI